MNQEELMRGLGNIVRKLFPELAERTHLPAKARVLAVRGEAGEVRVDGLGSRRYSVDVEPLTPDGDPDPERPTLLDVPLEVPWTGPGRGVFALPAVGSIVRVCFYGGSAAHPYIDGIVPDGFEVPAVAENEYLIRQSPEVRLRITDAGDIQLLTNAKVYLADLDGRPIAREGDQVEVVVASGSSAGVWTGTIKTGSDKVFAG